MGKIRVGVLMGGPSAEHEVSLKSGEMILRFLNPEKYAAEGIVIDKKGKWPMPLAAFKKRFDLAFIAMHGEYGEDGTLQRILDKCKIPYIGSGAQASEIGMDKAASSRLFKKAGLLVPDFKVVSVGKRIKKYRLSFKFPVVVKPSDRGSSVGVSIVNNSSGLQRALKNAGVYSKNVMIQKYIEGRELTCGVLERGGRLKALPPTEIIPSGSTFFDYNAKYSAGASREITPPNLPAEGIRKIQNIALKAHEAIGARGFSRTDMIIAENPKSEIRNPKVYVLEINTLPGMTETSLLPQEAKADGISFPELLDAIIESALR